MVGLVPLVVAVLATQGAFRPRETPPVASAPTAVQATLAPTNLSEPTQATSAATPTSVPAATVATAGPTAATAPTPAPNPTNGTATSPGTGVAASPTSGAAASPTSGVAAVATAGAAATRSASAAFIAYTVKPGDTVHFIARTYGVSPTSIIQASGLSNPDLLRIGQVLTIPAQPGYLYRVQPGETLDQIASRTGVASDQIASASGLTVASVGPGDLLLIPDEAVAQTK